MQGSPNKVTVWIRGNREFVNALKVIAIQDNTTVADLISGCLRANYKERLPDSVISFFEDYDRKNKRGSA